MIDKNNIPHFTRTAMAHWLRTDCHRVNLGLIATYNASNCWHQEKHLAVLFQVPWLSKISQFTVWHIWAIKWEKCTML